MATGWIPWPLLPAPLLLLSPWPDCVPVGVGGGCEREHLGSFRCGFGGWVLLLLLSLTYFTFLPMVVAMFYMYTCTH